MLRNLRKIYSPNFEIKKRKKSEIRSIILHYTGMKNEKAALNKLTNFDSRVSCHYFITYSGEIINLVPDLYISWHAGILSIEDTVILVIYQNSRIGTVLILFKLLPWDAHM